MKIKTVGDLKQLIEGLPDTSPIAIISGDNKSPVIDVKTINNGEKQLIIETDFPLYTDEDIENLYNFFIKDREAKRKKCSPAGVL